MSDLDLIGEAEAKEMLAAAQARIEELTRERDEARAEVAKLKAAFAEHIRFFANAALSDTPENALVRERDAANANASAYREALERLLSRIDSEPTMSGHLRGLRLRPDSVAPHVTSDSIRAAKALLSLPDPGAELLQRVRHETAAKQREACAMDMNVAHPVASHIWRDDVFRAIRATPLVTEAK